MRKREQGGVKSETVQSKHQISDWGLSQTDAVDVQQEFYLASAMGAIEGQE